MTLHHSSLRACSKQRQRITRWTAALLLSLCNQLDQSVQAQSAAQAAAQEPEAADSTALTLCKTDLRLSGAVYDKKRAAKKQATDVAVIGAGAR